MRSLTKRVAAFALLAAALVSAAAAQTAQSRRFSIPGHGSLLLDVPEDWRVAERPLANPPSTALRIGPASGDAFVLQITSLWLEAEKLAALTPRELEARVRKTAEEMLPQAVEKEAIIVALRGKQASGYHFSLTDRTLASGTDSHVRAHWVQAGTWIDLHLSMTSDRPAAETRRRLIEVLKSVDVREKN